ncbi:hypothetical protein HSX11_22210 [Oxalobacteraceae bacterium]|nr:hypothetical protein [Oxalobacteraceae bacterium]
MKGLAVIACVGMIALGSWLIWPEGPAQMEEAATQAASPGPLAPWSDLAAAAAQGQAAAPAQDELKRVPLLPVDDRSSAWLSMAEARENGDPRAPPVQRDKEQRIAPSAEQLADPQAYREYERSQHARLLTAFAAAADQEIPRLRADVERARAAGIPAVEIAKVEEKIRRIEQQRQGIVQARAAEAPR